MKGSDPRVGRVGWSARVLVVSRPWSQDFRAAQAVADSTFHRQKLFRACLFRSILLATRLVLRGEPSYTSYTRVSHPLTYTTLPYTFTPLECKSLSLLILFFSLLLYTAYIFLTDSIVISIYVYVYMYFYFVVASFESRVIVLVFSISDGDFSYQWMDCSLYTVMQRDRWKDEKEHFPRLRCRSLDRYISLGRRRGGRRIWRKIRVWKWNWKWRWIPYIFFLEGDEKLDNINN